MPILRSGGIYLIILKPDIRDFREYAPLALGFRRKRDLAMQARRAGLVEHPDRG